MKKLKNNLFVFFLLALFLLPGCRKLGEFKIKDSSEFTIPGTTPLGIFVPTPMEVASSSSYEFKNNGTETKHVKEVRLDQMTLTIIDPSTQTFKFLNSVHIYISADGLPEVEIAYLDNIPPTVGSSIELLTTGAVLDAYIKKEKYKLQVKTVTDDVLADDVKIRSDLTFRVKAKIL